MKQNVQYVTNSRGIKQAVLIPISEWQLFQKEMTKLRKYTGFYEKIEDSMREVIEIEKGRKKAKTLSEFLNEC